MIKQRQMTWAGAANGLSRFIIGLAKKLLIANTAAQITDSLYAQSSYGTAAAWMMALSYMIQIYFDFSGYSDMAIGMGEMFGFYFKENFLHPYVAQSMQDFWQRWHVSLSSWFKDYVYIPLGGNRHGKAKELRNKLIVFTLTGLWHGAAWTFVVRGLYHGIFLLLERTVLKVNSWPRIRRHLYTLLVVAAGFVIFRAESMTQAGLIIRSMFTPVAATGANNAAIAGFMTPLSIILLTVGVLAGIPWSKAVNLRPLPRYVLCGALWLLCYLNLSAATYNPFIYFRF